jgi:hypothetical protein
LRVLEVGLVAGEIGLRLIELRLIGARIELGQKLVFFDELTILEVDADVGSVTMLRTVAEFSAATLPIPVSTIGKFCFWTFAAMMGTGAGGSADALGLRAKCFQPK